MIATPRPGEIGRPNRRGSAGAETSMTDPEPGVHRRGAASSPPEHHRDQVDPGDGLLSDPAPRFESLLHLADEVDGLVACEDAIRLVIRGVSLTLKPDEAPGDKPKVGRDYRTGKLSYVRGKPGRLEEDLGCVLHVAVVEGPAHERTQSRIGDQCAGGLVHQQVEESIEGRRDRPAQIRLPGSAPVPDGQVPRLFEEVAVKTHLTRPSSTSRCSEKLRK